MIRIVNKEPLEFEASIPVDIPLEITYMKSNGTPYIAFSSNNERISTAYHDCGVYIFDKQIKRAGEAATIEHIGMIMDEIQKYFNMKYALLLHQYKNTQI